MQFWHLVTLGFVAFVIRIPFFLKLKRGGVLDYLIICLLLFRTIPLARYFKLFQINSVVVQRLHANLVKLFVSNNIAAGEIN